MDEGMEAGGQQEGEVKAAIADDGAGKGDDGSDEEHAQEGEDEAAAGEGKSGDGRGSAEAGFQGVGGVKSYGGEDDRPDQDQFY